MRRTWNRLRPGARAVAASFLISGTVHFVRPQVFEPLIPPALPAPRAWVVASGAAELSSAAGLLAGAKWAPAATTGTLLLVWPGNMWHALRMQRSRAHPVAKVAVWLRLPLQIPMIIAAHDPYQADVARVRPAAGVASPPAPG